MASEKEFICNEKTCFSYNPNSWLLATVNNEPETKIWNCTARNPNIICQETREIICDSCSKTPPPKKGTPVTLAKFYYNQYTETGYACFGKNPNGEFCKFYSQDTKIADGQEKINEQWCPIKIKCCNAKNPSVHRLLNRHGGTCETFEPKKK